MEIIEIDSKYFAADFFYSGSVKVGEEVYGFTLMNGDMEDRVEWETTCPFEDGSEIEAKILKQFRDR